MHRLANYLKIHLAGELPGQDAQKLMAPANRVATAEYLKNLSVKPRLSAVMLLLFPGIDKIPNILLIERPKYEGVHSGQIAFPGGKKDETDSSLIETALREMREETGYHGPVEIIGQLSDVYIPPSNFLVSPFVAYTEIRPTWNPAPREVASLIEAPLEFLNNDTCVYEGEFITSGNYKVKAPYFLYEGYKIWGATAIILSELRVILRKGWFTSNKL
ncbi:MAG: CoA pyrophosphatase [Flavobacteriales bacterium]|nr:CoA pyrophosphatase [Flavobacteriales bacterium]